LLGVQNNALASLYNQKVINLEFCNKIWTQLEFGNKIVVNTVVKAYLAPAVNRNTSQCFSYLKKSLI